MAADAFTQIRNAVFRDPRLSAKAMGIFGNISTHRDGWGVTPESIATQMRDGVNAIRAGLRELEEYGYLQRTQTRDPKTGRLGPSEYYITDQPEAATGSPDGENRRSDPSDDFPHAGNPHAGEPHAENHPHKKTSSSSRKNTSGKNTTSLSVPAQRTDESAIVEERETDAPQGKPTLTTAQRIVRAAGIVTADEEEAFIAWVTATHAPRGAAWWRAVDANGDLPDLAAAWRAPRAPAPTHGHGHRPYRGPDDHSVYDLGFDGRPLPGTDTRVAGWMALAAELRAGEGGG